MIDVTKAAKMLVPLTRTYDLGVWRVLRDWMPEATPAELRAFYASVREQQRETRSEAARRGAQTRRAAR
jgi:hypothetical protein